MSQTNLKCPSCGLTIPPEGMPPPGESLCVVFCPRCTNGIVSENGKLESFDADRWLASTKLHDEEEVVARLLILRERDEHKNYMAHDAPQVEMVSEVHASLERFKARYYLLGSALLAAAFGVLKYMPKATVIQLLNKLNGALKDYWENEGHSNEPN